MDWKKAIGFGVIIWFLTSFLIFFSVEVTYYGLFFPVTTAIISMLIPYLAAKAIEPANVKIALSYGAVWAIIRVVLDGTVMTWIEPRIFSFFPLSNIIIWSVWLGYALTLLIPITTIKKNGGAPAAPTGTV